MLWHIPASFYKKNFWKRISQHLFPNFEVEQIFTEFYIHCISGCYFFYLFFSKPSKDVGKTWIQYIWNKYICLNNALKRTFLKIRVQPKLDSSFVVISYNNWSSFPWSLRNKSQTMLLEVLIIFSPKISFFFMQLFQTFRLCTRFYLQVTFKYKIWLFFHRSQMNTQYSLFCRLLAVFENLKNWVFDFIEGICNT